ncbi:MAG: hypothetical protein LKG20_12280 [Tetrasphaera jenkinsii]|nr:hypothetical protein [Tetrasphaera jenkinsii]
MTGSLRGALVAAAVGGTLVMGGCSVGGADVAARVDGHVITESAARTAAEQVTKAFGLQEPLTIAQATGYLIEAPFLTKVAEGKGAILSDDAIAAEMGGMKPTPETLDVVRANYLHNQFAQTDPAALDEVSKAMKKASIRVNPRFGTFDRDAIALAPATPNWISSQSAMDQPASDQPATP